MKKNARLFVCFAILSILIVNLFTPTEKISHEVVSFTIDMLQPDETFQAASIEAKSKEKSEHLHKCEVDGSGYVQNLPSLAKEVGYDWS